MRFSLFTSFLFLLACSAPDGGTDDALKEDIIFSKTKFAAISALFDPGALVQPISQVDCTLSGGMQTQCLSVTLKPEPALFKIGPWCPRNIKDGPDVSGIWLEGGEVYDADGQFIQSLDKFYDDPTWAMFDPETGKVNVTDTQISCAAAARPDVDAKYQNHCVECEVSYMEPDASQTYIIPLTPNFADSVSDRIASGGVGVTFSGVKLDAEAPTDAILSAHTLAPFDDCGGHVNLHAGYHMHAVTEKPGCHVEVPSVQGHSAQIGLAMDGFAIFARLNSDGQEPTDLDMCRGHQVDRLGYHYHANAPGANAILTCHTGETGCAQASVEDECRADQNLGRRGPPGGGPPPGGRPIPDRR